MGLNRAYREQVDGHGMESLARVIHDEEPAIAPRSAPDYRDAMTAEAMAVIDAEQEQAIKLERAHRCQLAYLAVWNLREVLGKRERDVIEAKVRAFYGRRPPREAANA